MTHNQWVQIAGWWIRITCVIGNYQNCKFSRDFFAQIESQGAALVWENCQLTLYLHIDCLPSLDWAFSLPFVLALSTFLQTSNTKIFFMVNLEKVFRIDHLLYFNVRMSCFSIKTINGDLNVFHHSVSAKFDLSWCRIIRKGRVQKMFLPWTFPYGKEYSILFSK